MYDRCMNTVVKALLSILNQFYFSIFTVPATIYPSGQRDTLTGVKGYKITISFVIEDAFPEVQSENIDWYFLSDATNIQIPIRSTIDNRYTFDENRVSLTITDLDLIDRGRYIITATNEAGVRNSSIYLDIHGTYKGGEVWGRSERRLGKEESTVK